MPILMLRLARCVLVVQLLCALVVFGDAVTAQKQRPDGQFTRYTEDGNRLHIVPSVELMSRIPRIKAANGDEGVVQGFATVYPSPYGQELLTDHGDPEIPNAKVQAVYWNASVANATATSLGYGTVRDQINGFLNAFADGVNYRDVATADYTIIQQYGSNATIAPTLGNVASYVDTQTTSSTITDSAIRTYLAGRFNAGALTPNTSTLYAVFFPPGMTVNGGGDLSCSVFCGYHSWFTYNGSRIIYAAMPYLNCNACRFVSGGTVADQLTVVLSHEVREAVTDSFNSWYDSSGNEADDKCNSTHLYQMSNGGFWVQPEWSNGGTVTRSGFTATYPGPGCVVPGGASTPTAPSAPTGLTATAASSSQINLSWTGSSGATSYTVKRSTTSGAEVTIATGVGSTSYSDTGLAAGTRYFYVVAAVNSSGTSANSSEASATTSAPGAPAAPTGLTASAVSNSQISLTWTAVSGATSYVVRRGASSGSEVTIASAVGSTSYVDAGLAAGSQYFYVVAASNGSGTSANSAEVSATTLGTPSAIPSAPTGLTARATGSRIDLSWSASSGAISYNVRRGTTSGVWSLIASSVGSTGYADTSLASGTYYYVVSAVNGAGTSGNSNEASASVVIHARMTDFDGDGKSDPTIFRPSTGTWWVLRSSAGFLGGSSYQWGASTDTTLAGDFDGDGITDVAVYRPSTGAWWIRRSSLGFAPGTASIWGAVGDVPVPGDYDADGKTDLAVYRATTGQWLISRSRDGSTGTIGWGSNGDVPVPNDYDGDGVTDIAVYRPTSGQWLVLKSGSSTLGFYNFGATGDVPVPGDYDGDGATDVAVYRPSTGDWLILTSSSGFTSVMNYRWGAATDTPAIGDFDGDGKMDPAVFRDSTGDWWILRSSTGFTAGISYRWGAQGDLVIKR